MSAPTVGSLLRAARRIAGLTQQDVADRMYVSRSLIAYWETGRRDPKISQVLAFSEAVGVRIDFDVKESA